MRTRSLELALILLTSAAIGRSQTAPAAPAGADGPAAVAKPAAPADAAQGTDAVATGVTRNKDTLSVDFPDEDVRTILRNVADLFELNLVGMRRLLPMGSIHIRSGKVVLRAGDPIPTAGLKTSDHTELTLRLHREVAHLLEEPAATPVR